MSWVGIISAVASLAGSAMQSRATKSAGNDQSEAAGIAAAESGRQFNLTRSDLAPYREIGKTALGSLGGGLGLPGYDAGPDTGFLSRRFTMADFESDPVVQASLRYGLEEGTKGVNRAFGARGMSKSGSAIKALERFAADYAGTQAAGSQQRFVADQSNRFNREAAVAGIGQAATTTTGQFGAGNAARVGDLGIQAANARGAASIAGANAYAGSLNSIGNNLQQRYYLDSFSRPSNSGTTSSDPYAPGSQPYYMLGE